MNRVRCITKINKKSLIYQREDLKQLAPPYAVACAATPASETPHYLDSPETESPLQL